MRSVKATFTSITVIYQNARSLFSFLFFLFFFFFFRYPFDPFCLSFSLKKEHRRLHDASKNAKRELKLITSAHLEVKRVFYEDVQSTNKYPREITLKSLSRIANGLSKYKVIVKEEKNHSFSCLYT